MVSLTAEGCAARRARLIEASRVAGLDLAIIVNPRHLLYFAGLYVSQLSLSAHGLNFLLIDVQTGHSTLVVHSMIAGAAKRDLVDEVAVWRSYDFNGDPAIDPYSTAVDELSWRLARHAHQRVGYEKGWLPHGLDVGGIAHLMDIAPLIVGLRRQKHADELALIRDAIAVNAAGHQAARALLTGATSPLSELDVYNAAHTAMVEAAGEPIHLLGDFVGAARSAQIGLPASATRLALGDLMIVDMFPIVNGYRADFTVTLAVGGQKDERAKTLEAGLHAALAAGEALLRPGTTGRAIHRAVKAALADYDLADGFPHHAGHGLGLGHPEAPFFVANSDEALIAGDVVTLEPGSYNAVNGARIEHNYLITATGFERLTAHDTRF
jgi:Xaa-Pro aminopeptidase